MSDPNEHLLRIVKQAQEQADRSQRQLNTALFMFWLLFMLSPLIIFFL